MFPASRDPFGRGYPCQTRERRAERGFSGPERSAGKRKTIKVLRASGVALREGTASPGTSRHSVTTPEETLAAAFRPVKNQNLFK